MYLKTTTVPVIVRTLGKIKKGTDENMKKIPGSPNHYEIEKNSFIRNIGLDRATLYEYMYYKCTDFTSWLMHRLIMVISYVKSHNYLQERLTSVLNIPARVVMP